MARSKEDLEHLIEKRGLAPMESLRVRELTEKEILSEMPEPVYEWHYLYNRPNIEKAMAAKKIKQGEQKTTEEREAKQFWDGIQKRQLGGEQLKKAKEASDNFCAKHPQYYRNNLTNDTAIAAWFKSRTLAPTEANLREAFVELAKNGKLILNPAAIGVIRIRLSNGQVLDMHESDLSNWQQRNHEPKVEILAFEEITGRELVCSSQLQWLLKAYPEGSLQAIKQTKMSAEQFKPAVQKAFENDPNRVRSVIEEFKKAHPDYPLTDESREHMVSYMDKRKKVYTVANLKEAYQTLVAEGYIEPNRDYVNRLYEEVQNEIRGKSAKEYEEWLRIPGNIKRANIQRMSAA
jgi:hypothetical protein